MNVIFKHALCKAWMQNRARIAQVEGLWHSTYLRLQNLKVMDDSLYQVYECHVHVRMNHRL